jgi:hypothetical protein
VGESPHRSNCEQRPGARSKSGEEIGLGAQGGAAVGGGGVPPPIKRERRPGARSKSGRAGFGAGDGNRTRVNSLEGYRTTIVLHPLWWPVRVSNPRSPA